MDLNGVRMFVQVVRARSFAEAARRLGVPSNTLSRRVRQLEEELDTRLLQRSTRKLTLTAAGSAFFERSAVALDGVLDAGKALVGESVTPSGRVRVAAPADFLDLFAMEWVAEFLTRHPKVKLEFVLNDARADLIEEGLDVAFRGGPVADPEHVFRRLSAQYFKLVASPAYLAVRGTPATLQDLRQHDCLTAADKPSASGWILEGPNGSEHVTVKGRFGVNSARILCKSCAAGFGIAMLPSMLADPEIRAGRLVQILAHYRRAGADLSVVVPSMQQIPSAVSAFIAFAADKLQSILR